MDELPSETNCTTTLRESDFYEESVLPVVMMAESFAAIP